jgi:hypothetical protein
MPTRNEYLKLAEECAVMARTARSDQTRTVWQQMTKLYRYIAERADGVAAMSNDQLDRPARAS